MDVHKEGLVRLHSVITIFSIQMCCQNHFLLESRRFAKSDL